MEVFLRNLPPHLTDQALQTQLEQFIGPLGFADWSCQKPRNKPFGNITFLHPNDGQRFLQHYGRQLLGRGQAVARLVILGSEVQCSVSTRMLDPFLLKSLRKSADGRKAMQARNILPQTDDNTIAINAQSISCGYYDYSNGDLVYVPEVTWQPTKVLARFTGRALIIELDTNSGKSRVEIPHRIVEALIVSHRHTTLTFTLWETPSFFYVRNRNIAELLANLSIQNRDAPERSRLTGLPYGSTDHQSVISQSIVYQVVASPLGFEQAIRKLHDRDILPIHYQYLQDLPSQMRGSLAEALVKFKATLQVASKHLPFRLLYQWEALVVNSYLLPWVVETLIRRMIKLSEATNLKSATPDFPISAEAVKKLFSQVPFPGPDVGESNFDHDEIWRYLEDNERELRQGFTKELISERGRQNLTMIHKVNVTPTGESLHGPEPEAKNRILRRFPEFTDYFIRVQFCEEDGTDLRFNANVSNAEIYDRFRSIFRKGITIAGRVYGFLGFSHSSLRSHAAWFVAPFFHDGKLQTYFSIIAHLGDFGSIYSPARCAARIGQAFSETPLAIPLTSVDIDYVDDVTSLDGFRMFSDGVGTLSRPVMEAIQAVVPRPKLTLGPTCFQIRCGGAKGMLSLDPRLDGSKVCFRPSMLKFESTDNANLEICDMARKPIPLVLNRQMIKILEDMGISDSWFMQQQQQELRCLQLVTAHIANTVGFLKRQSVADSVGFPRLIRRLDNAGIDYRKDQFLSAVVEAAVLRELRLLKHKARIPVPHGVTLFGIMDETSYLDENEIYIAFDDAPFISDGHKFLDNRLMIVTRSPALHPGDIQFATNMIPPEHHPLRQLRNCIVFSQKGTRDLPSCLSGGDLDGDIYNIIWDEEAVRKCQRVYQPADYPRLPPMNIGRPVQREDMTEFFITFMATDQLGLIATRHMILADQKLEGTNHPDCLTLAELHSTSVDYSKTGIPPDMEKFRKIKMSKYRPDFLAPAPPANIKKRTEISFDTSNEISPNDGDEDSAGPRYQYYYSDNISGKLFRAIDESRIWFQDIKSVMPKQADIWVDVLNFVNKQCDRIVGGVQWSEHEKEASQIRLAYEDAIYTATVDYSDHAAIRITELEVFTGTIFNKSGVQTRRQRDKSIQLKDEFERIAHWTENMIRKRNVKALDDAGQEGHGVRSDDALALSVACLIVGCMKQQTRGGRRPRQEDTFQSFKVVAACCAIKELDAAKTRTQV
ncbi:RNA-dependent RNA polymerase [Paraphaeosphaeria sporulosa]